MVYMLEIHAVTRQVLINCGDIDTLDIKISCVQDSIVNEDM